MNVCDKFKNAVEGAICKLKIPALTDILQETQNEFMEKLRSTGLSSATEPWGLLKKKLESGSFDLDTFDLVLAELIAVGCLGLEEKQLKNPSSQLIKNHLKKEPLPALIRFRQSSGILFVGDKETGVINAQLVILRLLLTIHPSLLSLTLVDTQSLGRSLKLLTHLRDATNINLIFDSQSLEQEISKLCEIAIKRNSQVLTKFDWLYEYNDHHSETPEPYHVVLFSDGLHLLDDKTQRILTSLLTKKNAAHAGIYFIICSDEVLPNMDAMSVLTQKKGNSLELYQAGWMDTREEGPQSILKVQYEKVGVETIQGIQTVIHKRSSIGRASAVSVTINQDQWWSKESSRGVRIPIGKSGSEVQEFILGEDKIVHNALIGGSVGTGKSVLLHTIISNMVSLYSPMELRLHLLDYKEGTEFNSYRNLPHLDSLSIGPSVEFGYDVLKELKKEIGRRGELFKKASTEKVTISKIEDYRKITSERLSRHILIIDEFQVLLMDNRLGEKASETLEDIVRRGRAFGINVILSTQSLRGCNLSSSTRSNLGLRICLRLSENDCIDFLGSGNTVPSSFDRPGTALYNDKEGSPSSNRLFQASYIEMNKLMSLIKKLEDRAKKMNLVAGIPSIYEADSFVSATELMNEVKAGNIVLGRQLGLHGVPVCFNPGSDDFRSLLVVGQTEKLDPVYLSLVKQLTSSTWELHIVTDDAPGNKLEMTYADAHQQWQQILNADCDSPPQQKTKTIYLLMDPQISPALRNETSGIKLTLTTLFSMALHPALKFIICSRSYSVLRDSGVVLDFRTAFSHFLLLDQTSLRDHNGNFESLAPTNAWFESEYEPEGSKIKLASIS